MPGPAASEQFYAKLKSFADFNGITTDQHYTRVPEDWIIVLTDIRGSTKAIEAGRYKDVNTIGAASISVVQELLKTEFPYVFGGDGATLLLPPDALDTAIEGLRRLTLLARSQFNLELRVGTIPVKEVVAAGYAVEVAKMELAAGKCVSMFRGGGLGEAERRIKGDDSRHCRFSEDAGSLDLTGLSCRWSPLPNKRGCILSLLVLARSANAVDVYQRFLVELNSIFEGRLEEANPVKQELMTYHSAAETIANEKRFHTSRWGFAWFKRMFEIFATVLFFKHHVPPLIFDAKNYLNKTPMHSDYRKFDDMLRMVIDCSREQADAIRSYLEKHHLGGELYFGIHASDSALMTCYVQNVEDGQHIHFIDGGNGGYAMAAKQLKQQMKEPILSPSQGG